VVFVVTGHKNLGKKVQPLTKEVSMKNENGDGLQSLQAKLNEPQTAASLNRLMDRLDSLEQAVNSLTEMIQQAPGLAAMVGDVADETYRRSAERGVDIEARLKTALALAERLTEPQMMANLTQALTMLEQAPGLAAMVGDVADETYRRSAERGVDIEARLKTALALAERLTEPQMMANLEQLLTLLEQAPGLTAMLGDIADEAFTTFKVPSRIEAGWPIIHKATDPHTLRQLDEMFDVLLEAESGMLHPEAVGLLGVMARAMVDAKHDPPRKVGLFTLLGTLNDPEIQAGLSFLLNFAHRFGKHLQDARP
jgi:hypothetical protein